MRYLLAAALVALLFVAWAVTDREPTAEECCMFADIPQTCVKRLYRAENGQLVPADSCEKYRPK